MNRAVPVALTESLLQVPLFEDLDEDEVQAVADSMHETNVPAGSVVTAEGDPADGFFVIDRGEAEVTVHGQWRGTMTAGDYFGEIALLTGSDRTATITATSDLHCYGMTPWDFRPLVESNSGIAWKLLTAMAEKLR